MFKSLKRTLVGRQCVIALNDTCFKTQFLDDICPCSYVNCAFTSVHLIREYSNRNLNVPRNLARYFYWLEYSHGCSQFDELNSHTYELRRSRPHVGMDKYSKLIKHYLKHEDMARFLR